MFKVLLSMFLLHEIVLVASLQQCDLAKFYTVSSIKEHRWVELFTFVRYSHLLHQCIYTKIYEVTEWEIEADASPLLYIDNCTVLFIVEEGSSAFNSFGCCHTTNLCTLDLEPHNCSVVV